jgi:hypothetical protein
LRKSFLFPATCSLSRGFEPPTRGFAPRSVRVKGEPYLLKGKTLDANMDQAQSDDDKEELIFERTPKLIDPAPEHDEQLAVDIGCLRHVLLGPSRLSQDKASVLVCKLIKLVLVTQERHGSLNAMKLDNEEAKADHQHLAAACTKHLDFDFDFRPMWLRVGGCKQSLRPTQPRLPLPKRLRPGGRTLRPTQPTLPPPKWLRLGGRTLRPTQPTLAPPMSLRAGGRIQSLRPTQPAFPPPTWLRTTAAGSAPRPHPPSFPPDD